MVNMMYESIIAFLWDLMTNKIFISGLLAWFIAQGLKILILAFKKNKFRWSFFMRRGNMPSSHSSTVTALTTVLFLTEGVTPLSVTALIFSLVVIRDALDVNIGIPQDNKIGHGVRTYIHKPREVMAGIALGFLIAVIVVII